MKSEDMLRLLRKIPKGKVTTYKCLAEASGSKGYRAVGQILRNNPRPDIYPCYKVVKSDGNLGGYNGSNPKHLKRKIKLLKKDGIEVKNNKIDITKFLFRV